MAPLSARCRSAFTLPELLIVLAIVAVLIGLVLPAIHRVRLAASRMQSARHLEQIGTAFRAHHDAQGVLPHGGTQSAAGSGVSSGASPTDRAQWTWAYQILPYIQQEAVYKACVSVVDATPINIYYVPARRSATLYGGYAKIDYAGCAGTGDNGAVVEGPVAYLRLVDITDGTSNTVLVGEKRLNPLMFGRSADDDKPYARAGWSDDFQVHRLGNAQPSRDDPVARDPTPSRAFGSPLCSGFNCVFADGSVRHVRYNVNLLTWQRACVRNDGEVLVVDEL